MTHKQLGKVPAATGAMTSFAKMSGATLGAAESQHLFHCIQALLRTVGLDEAERHGGHLGHGPGPLHSFGLAVGPDRSDPLVQQRLHISSWAVAFPCLARE